VTVATWAPAEYEDAARAEIDRMADAVRASDLAARVPSCPDWNVAELVAHVGRIHRWAARMVRDRASERLDPRSFDLELPADATDARAYGEWLAAGGDLLGDAFAATDPDADVWSWGADQHARFWSRRMLHETCMHRVDADLACGQETTVDARIAADGIGELLANIPTARYFRPRVAELRGEGESIALRSRDRDEGWHIRLRADGFEWEPVVASGATVTVTAPTETLLLVLYGRRPATATDLEGDDALLARWLEASKL
jgi:uncharacterized protein (TIGR03083 family)